MRTPTEHRLCGWLCTVDCTAARMGIAAAGRSAATAPLAAPAAAATGRKHLALAEARRRNHRDESEWGWTRLPPDEAVVAGRSAAPGAGKRPPHCKRMPPSLPPSSAEDPRRGPWTDCSFGPAAAGHSTSASEAPGRTPTVVHSLRKIRKPILSGTSPAARDQRREARRQGSHSDFSMHF